MCQAWEGEEETEPTNMEQVLRLVMDKINSGVIVIDSRGRIIYVNRACEDILKVSFNEVKSLHYADAFKHIPEEERFTLRTLITGEEFNDIGYDSARFNDMYVITNTVLLKDDQNRILGAAGVFRDITAVQELQNKLKEKEQLAVLAEMAKGMAHEIRNPLTGINIFLQMIKQEPQGSFPSRFIDENLDTALSELEKIKNLINDFLELAKPDTCDYKQQDLGHLINIVVNSLTSRLDSKNIQLNLELQNEVKIWGEQSSLKQMILYILNNAIDILPPGGEIKIKTSLDEDRVLIKITDNGPGMTCDVKNHIYIPFFTTKEYGTGLGLTIVKKIVHGYGGNIDVESTPGAGTSFKILLPRSKS